MGRENKKEAVAALHREHILTAAQELFSERGFEQTTIDDISKKSEYSRRTVYAYFDSKDDIMHHIIESGLIELKNETEKALRDNDEFMEQYNAVCTAMRNYQKRCPQSFESVQSAKNPDFSGGYVSDTVKRIFALGEEINGMLAEFIEKGKRSGTVRQDVEPMMSVYVIWASISSLISLAETKGRFISEQFAVSVDDFLEYGFRQIINSILAVRSPHGLITL